jgi:putative nucleotidyltransferase with HDIG domain
VIQSEGGQGVFSTLDRSSFDLVICDIKMPDVDGVEVLDYVTGNFATVPIIMLTGLTDIAVAIDVMKKGAFDYLMKPIKKHDLLTAIHKAVVHRDILVRNEELERENREYQLFLEEKVKDRTKALNERTLELQDLNEHLKHMNIQFVNVLAETIEAKDGHTSGHCNRMRYLCVELGRLAGLGPEDLERLEYASLLHDLGKIGTSEAVLNKPGPLTKEEADHIKEHPVRGEKILNGIDLMEDVARIIGAHHENFDGSGYPKGLREAEIPLEARIIAVADLFDAMSSDRPYRAGLALDKVLAEMQRVAGSQLDPDMVKLFIDNKVFQFKKN